MIKNAIRTKKGRLLPAYPLFVKDPYFSIWSPCDELNAGDTIFWTTMRRRIYGVVRANGKAYSFMGLPDRTEKLRQTSVAINAFSTEYTFASEEFDLTVTFTSPLPPDDLELLSTPVCYFGYEVRPKKPLSDVSVSLMLHEESCYNEKPMPVRGGVHKLAAGECAWFGLKKQLVMSQAYDSAGAEWGYWFFTAKSACFTSEDAAYRYIQTGELDFAYSQGRSGMLVAVDSYEHVDAPVEGMMSLAFDDTVSIYYFGEWLRGYWTEGGKTIFDAIESAHANYRKVLRKLDAFNRDLCARAAKYGDDYLLVLYAGLRQSVGAHKLVKDREGEVLFLSKECHSNGCIATVDVSYPSIPLYLLYSPELVKGMMRPIFKFARTRTWKYDFAPHDAGTYPYCLGQVYGVKGLFAPATREQADYNNLDQTGEHKLTAYSLPMFYEFPTDDLYDFKLQMPVEECGNMLVMAAATLLADGDDSIVRENIDLLDEWVKYLLKYGLVPGNQLCTDDFAGHLDKNINLSVKAIVGIRAYAVILDALGRKKEAKEYVAKAEEYAAEWKKMCVTAGRPTPLVFDGGEDTFSLKYNMAFDVIMGSGLFDEALRETEVDAYIARENRYGTPLDSRETYTKSDWILWASVLTSDIEKRKKLIAPVARFLHESGTRAPFTDWYYTDSGLVKGHIDEFGRTGGFMNRTVQGGLFAPLLADSGKLALKK